MSDQVSFLMNSTWIVCLHGLSRFYHLACGEAVATRVTGGECAERHPPPKKATMKSSFDWLTGLVGVWYPQQQWMVVDGNSGAFLCSTSFQQVATSSNPTFSSRALIVGCVVTEHVPSLRPITPSSLRS